MQTQNCFFKQRFFSSEMQQKFLVRSNLMTHAPFSMHKNGEW